MNFKGARSLTLAVNVPHAKEDLLQIFHPLRGVKERAPAYVHKEQMGQADSRSYTSAGKTQTQTSECIRE